MGYTGKAMPDPEIDEEVRRVRELLVAQVRRRFSGRALERKLGAKGGTTRKVLHGDITLTVRHILQYLDAVGTPWGEFFRSAYPKKDDEALERRVGRLALQALRPAGPPESPDE